MTPQLSFISSSAPFSCSSCGNRVTHGFSMSGYGVSIRQCRPCTEWEVGTTRARAAIDEHKTASFGSLEVERG
jgi:hypothetical protein